MDQPGIKPVTIWGIGISGGSLTHYATSLASFFQFPSMLPSCHPHPQAHTFKEDVEIGTKKGENEEIEKHTFLKTSLAFY